MFNKIFFSMTLGEYQIYDWYELKNNKEKARYLFNMQKSKLLSKLYAIKYKFQFLHYLIKLHGIKGLTIRAINIWLLRRQMKQLMINFFNEVKEMKD